MEALEGPLALGFLASFVAGFVLLFVRDWRANAKWAFSLAGVSFLLFLGVTGGALAIAAITVMASLFGLGIALILFVLPQSRNVAASTLKASFLGLGAGICALFFVVEPTSDSPKYQEAAPLSEPATIAPAKKPLLSEKPNIQTNSEQKLAALQRPPEANSLSTAPKTENTAQTMYVDASRLNVRAGPSKTHKVIWTLKNNEKVLVIDRNGSWALLQGDRYQGWVFVTYLTPKPGALKATKPREPVPATSNLRPRLSDAQIAEILIKRSHAYYSGNCPCPYNRARNGSRCGKRSAYSRPGGASPLCYVSDVTNSMIADYRSRQ